MPSPAINEDADPIVNLDMRNIGSTGLRNVGGLVREEFLPELTGQRGMLAYKKMVDEDSTAGAIIYAIDKLVRRVGWRVDAASSRPVDAEAAEFLESCMGDMQMTWIEHISEFLSMLVYGFSLHEIVYKRRAGNSPIKSFRSKYADGRIGWRYMPIRAQETILMWEFDEGNDVVAALQNAPPKYGIVKLPLHKCVLFRTSSHKNSPEGRSILRSAYRDWYIKKHLQNIEAVGAERDCAGIPVAWMPPAYFAPGATTEQKATFELMKKVVANLRNDEQAGLVLPLAYDASGNKLFDLNLMSSGGSKQYDCDKIIQRYDHRMAMSVLADFILMGQASSSTGSLAMHQDKTGMFGQCVSVFLDVIQETMQEPIRKLFELNSFPVTEYPRIVHEPIDNVDIAALGSFLTQCAQAGMPLFPNPELEAHIYKLAGFPSPLDNEAMQAEQQVQRPPDSEPDAEVRETHDASSLEPVDPLADDAGARALAGEADALKGPPQPLREPGIPVPTPENPPQELVTPTPVR